MLKEKRNNINNFADEIRKILNITDNQFDICKVVKSFNGSINYDDSLEYDKYITKTSDRSFNITLNSSCRNRFSIAHELGHLFLHMRLGSDKWNNIKNGTSFYRNFGLGLTNSAEEEADEFAFAFLMPIVNFIRVADETSDEDYYYPEKIANVFNVSKHAVIIRGRNLKLWT